MRILVTGANGMLGRDLCRVLAENGDEVFPTDRDGTEIKVDITNSIEIREALYETDALVIINCAAYTDVDGAESNVEEAYRVNTLGARVLAQACDESAIPLLHISTDFVFGGEKSGGYTEFDQPSPRGVYARSKYAGEIAVREAARRHWIVRTSWLYGVHGKCFPNTILNAAQQRPFLRVVDDQRGCPTWTVDLAKSIATQIMDTPYGTYHVCNSGAVSWLDFARQILAESAISTPVEAISSEDWIAGAPRPSNSELIPFQFDLLGLPRLRPWAEALTDYLNARTKLLGTQ